MVGREQTRATYRLSAPRDVLKLLTRIAAMAAAPADASDGAAAAAAKAV